eukprot:1191116-Prorocentrum_minimum.AAC.4
MSPLNIPPPSYQQYICQGRGISKQDLKNIGSFASHKKLPLLICVAGAQLGRPSDATRISRSNYHLHRGLVIPPCSPPRCRPTCLTARWLNHLK